MNEQQSEKELRLVDEERLSGAMARIAALADVGQSFSDRIGDGRIINGLDAIWQAIQTEVETMEGAVCFPEDDSTPPAPSPAAAINADLMQKLREQAARVGDFPRVLSREIDGGDSRKSLVRAADNELYTLTELLGAEPDEDGGHDDAKAA